MPIKNLDSQAGSGFFFKILFSLLILNGITIAVLFYIAYIFSEQSLSNHLKNNISQQIEQLAHSFDYENRQLLFHTLRSLENSTTMDEYIRSGSAEKLVLSRRIERRFLQLQSDHKDFTSIQFINAEGNTEFGVRNGQRQFGTQHISKKSNANHQSLNQLFNQLRETPLLLSSGNMEWFMPPREMLVKNPVLQSDGNYTILAGFSKLDKDTGLFGGLLVIELSLERLFDQYKKLHILKHNPVWLLNKQGDILIKPGITKNVKNSTIQLNPIPFLPVQKNFSTQVIDTTDGLIAYRDLAMEPGNPLLRLVISIPDQLLKKDLEPTVHFFLLVSIISAIFILFFSFFISRYLALPVKELTITRNQLANAQRLANLGHWEWDSSDKKINLSEHATWIFGRNKTDNILKLDTFLDYIPDQKRKIMAAMIEKALIHHIPGRLDHELKVDKGENRYVHQEIDIIDIDPIRIIGTIQDISERRRAEARIRQLAYQDPITDLPNRAKLYELTTSAVKDAISTGSILAIIFLDLDKFKRVNDTIGHNAGDELLRQVSLRIQGILRPSDSIGTTSDTVARLGGDEFVLILRNLKQEKDAARVAERILSILREPFNIQSTQINTSASLGISFFPTHGDNVNELLQHADSAMYQAKTKGRAQYAIYNSSIDKSLRNQQMLETRLQQALEKDEFILYYQPRIDCQTNKIISLETLIRWQHPEQGLIYPDSFISVAEKIGLIIPIGQFVLREACKQLAEWQNKIDSSLMISINLSPLQFSSKTLVDDIRNTLDEMSINAQSIELEVTEQALFEDIDTATEMANTLKSIGITLSIDDFGTGYSSLQQLKLLPIDILKIDRSFINDILIDNDDKLIVEMSIELAHSLGLKVVAEGVENVKQATILKNMHCDELQGYYFSRPEPAQVISKLLTSKNFNTLDI